MGDYWCKECGMPCETRVIDVGIGNYEFQGQKCCQTDLVEASECCEGELLEYDPLDLGEVGGDT
jgi:hypothetical protein